MNSLIIVFFVGCHTLFYTYACSQELYSALSCILTKSNNYDLTDHQQRWNQFFNATNYDSPETKINFRLYTQQYPSGKEILFKDEQSLKESGFEAHLPTRIITHGFNGRGDDDSCMDPMKAFLLKGRFNVIIMDWSAYQSKNYFDVVKRVKPTALHLLEMIHFLKERGMNTTTTTLIGHSLGAHVIGIAGYNSKFQINHVVGLDPAEPNFRNKGPGERISREDAAHVEIIHTNAGHCGLKEAIGHYDFYLNEGSRQPGCKKNLCSHDRSNRYYKESIISSIGFYGSHCNNLESIGNDKCTGEIAMMGGLFRTIASPGIYSVETNNESPYAKGYPDTIVESIKQ